MTLVDLAVDLAHGLAVCDVFIEIRMSVVVTRDNGVAIGCAGCAMHTSPTLWGPKIC